MSEKRPKDLYAIIGRIVVFVFVLVVVLPCLFGFLYGLLAPAFSR